MVGVGVGGCFRFGCLECEATATTLLVMVMICFFVVWAVGLLDGLVSFLFWLFRSRTEAVFKYETCFPSKSALNPTSVRQFQLVNYGQSDSPNR